MFTGKTGLWPLVILIVIILIAALLIRLALQWNAFRRELRYLETEIRRTSGRERQRFVAQKRRLWLSLLFFVRY